ncbi:MAG: DNA mismatch repair endonuclease MutL [Vulcanimicrobiaceae bacterium]
MIELLDEATIGAIAAGEIVERPLSVVKELIENALDAGARRIAIAVRGGGLDAIDVSDDGCGIAPAQLALALARHATSKLRRPDDLERIATLGFRGEGLASIAAVARVRLRSRLREHDVGTELAAVGGASEACMPVAMAPGTQVIVEDLFANVPARRAYLRTPSAEFARISNFVATLALGYPEVAFSLSHEGRTSFALAASRSLEERLAAVFGTSAGALLALDPYESDGVGVAGYASAPGSERGDRRLQVLFVNRRLLHSTQLAGAWTAAYASYALVGRQPFGVLFLSLASDDVDPNVHPTKFDVRLRRPQIVSAAVRRALRATLARDASERVRAAISLAPPQAASAEGTGSGAAGEAVADAAESALAAAFLGSYDSATQAALRVLAQLDATYLLATDGRALVLVDQHAAHERVAYEAIVARARNGNALSEPLLVPDLVELDTSSCERLERVRDEFAAGGLEIEPFGPRTYRVLATPAGYGARRFDLRAILADLDDDGPGLAANERIWASLACHSVVRAGDRLEPGEGEALLARLLRCANPMHCPHGRPTIVRIEPDEIARRFRRT